MFGRVSGDEEPAAAAHAPLQVAAPPAHRLRGPRAHECVQRRAAPQDHEGLKRLFKRVSFPGGIPSHVAPETPGSIHEGGELGYSLAHAFGAASDNPELSSRAWLV